MIDKLLFILLAIFWGGSFLAIQNTIEIIPSFTSAFYRVFFSTIFIFIFFHKDLFSLKKIPSKEIIISALTGLCAVGIPFGLLFWGEKYVSPSVAAIINGTVPLWTLLFSVTVFGDKTILNFTKKLGVILGIIGLFFIFYPKLILKNEALELYGLLAIFFMAISYAIGINLNRKIQITNKHLSNRQNLIVQQFSSAVFLLLSCLVIDGVPNLNLLTYKIVAGSIFYLSFFSTALAFIIFYRLIRTLGSVKAASVTYFVPAVALILDNLIFKRSLLMNEYIGSVIVFVSIYFLQRD